MALEAGQELLHYRLIEKIGEGGMGVVWKATDTDLGRDVAIKVLPDGLAADADRLARFEREARLLASLNHPNIATVHGLHAADDVRFLAMELVDGEDLAQRLARGPVDVDETVRLAIQIADALETAHEAGVIHRDVKPANLFLTAEGKVKVLDFGLAKALSPEPGAGGSGANLSLSPTMTSAGTVAGVILGTASYMSPEQARGRPTDRRADIWAFGCVLYEMLTGRRLFDGETVSDALAAVLRATPDLDALPNETPAALRGIMRRCLEKDPRDRLRDIGEARIALTRGDTDPQPGSARGPVPRAGRFGPVVLATLAGVALVGAVVGALADRASRPAPAETRERKLSLAPPAGITGPRLEPRIAPDGHAMAYIADGRLWVQPLDSLTPQPVPEGEGASKVAWSPDSGSLVFAVRSKIWRTRANGESALIAEIPTPIGAGGGLAWAEPEGIVYATGDDNLYVLPATGGSAEVLLAPDLTTEADFHTPSALPGGGVLFVVHKLDGSTNQVDALRDGVRSEVYAPGSIEVETPVYSPTGHLLYAETTSGTGLWAVPFALDRLAVTGEPFRITDSASQPGGSADGSLLYSNVPNVGGHQIVRVDRDGRVIERIGDPVTHADNVVLSPDGTKLAVCLIESQGNSLWVYDLERSGARSRIATDLGCGGSRGQFAWTHDGRILGKSGSERRTIRVLEVDGRSPEADVADGERPTVLVGDTHVIFVRLADDGREDLWALALGPDHRAANDPEPWVARPGRQMAPKASPTHPLIAYVDDSSGRSEVFLRTFPDRGTAWQVSDDGGSFPLWSDDGKRLLFLQDEVLVMEVDVELVESGPVGGNELSVRMSDPRQLFAGDTNRLGLNHGWDVVGSGESFLTVEIADTLEVGDRDLTLVTGWKP